MDGKKDLRTELNDDLLESVTGGKPNGKKQNNCPENLTSMKSTCIGCTHCVPSLTMKNMYHCDIVDGDYIAKVEQDRNGSI